MIHRIKPYTVNQLTPSIAETICNTKSILSRSYYDEKEKLNVCVTDSVHYKYIGKFTSTKNIQFAIIVSDNMLMFVFNNQNLLVPTSDFNEEKVLNLDDYTKDVNYQEAYVSLASSYNIVCENLKGATHNQEYLKRSLDEKSDKLILANKRCVSLRETSNMLRGVLLVLFIITLIIITFKHT